jgi:hypothetical protein
MLVFVLIAGAISASGIGYREVFGHPGLFHPANYTVNMCLWIPLATLCTWLTSNRHVLLLAFAVNFMTVAVALVIEGLGLGLSHVVFGVGAAIESMYVLEGHSSESDSESGSAGTPGSLI